MIFKLKNSSLELDDNDYIMAGIDFRMQYLGWGELSEYGGTDEEIANVIHDIHSMYAERKISLKKAPEIKVFVDTQGIYVNWKKKTETMMNFPMTQVRDVTMCLSQSSYSKTCVLVAREVNDRPYQAFVFYFKTSLKAVQFYRMTSLAFKVSFELFERFGYFGGIGKGEVVVLHSQSTDEKLKKALAEGKGEEDQDGSSTGSGKRTESFIECKDGNFQLNTSNGHVNNMNNKDRQRTITFEFGYKPGSVKRNDEREYVKIALDLDHDTRTLGKKLRFSLSKWISNTYQSFRIISGRYSAPLVDEIPL